MELRRCPTYTDWMKHRVDSQQGKAIYGHRMSVVEPAFGNIGSNKRLNRFSLRSKKKVQGQWQLYCLVHHSLVILYQRIKAPNFDPAPASTF